VFCSRVRLTDYFLRNVLPRRPYLRLEWLEQALEAPEWMERQENDRVRYWVYIPQMQRYLRVVTLADGETIHNAFPDRRFRRPDR
jgi:hypothetical protein